MNTVIARELLLWGLLTCVVLAVPIWLLIQPLVRIIKTYTPQIGASARSVRAKLFSAFEKRLAIRQAKKAAKEKERERLEAQQKLLDEKTKETAITKNTTETKLHNEVPAEDNPVSLGEGSDDTTESLVGDIQPSQDSINQDISTTTHQDPDLGDNDSKTDDIPSQEDKNLGDDILAQPGETLQQTTDSINDTIEKPLPTPPQTRTHSSDLDQQKFHKQLESIKYAALTYKERGKADKYEKKLIEGLSLDQNNQEFMSMLADHYFTTGNYVKALTLLKKIITIQTENHKAIWQIGRIYQSQKKSDAAQLLIQKALEKKPDHPKYLISLVEIYYEKDEKRNALEIMQRLRKIRPTNIDYLLTVATLHEELNEPTFARNYYMKILELNPNNEHAKQGLKNL